MKNILLTSTALVAFAGAAAAAGHTSINNEFGATLGYNSENNPGEAGENGFYWEGNMKTTATATLDNGLTAGAYFEVTIADDSASATDDGGNDLVSSDFVLSLTSDTASLFFGDTAPAGKKYFSAAGDMEGDDFSTDSDAAVLRGDVSFGMMNGSISYIVDDANNTAEQLAVGLGATFGAFTLGLGYQEDTTFTDAEGDFNNDEVFGVSVAGTFAGATVTVAYAEEMGGVDVDDNYGVEVAYAEGAIGVTAKFRNEQGRDEWNLEGSYDLGNGMTVLAGALNENEGDADFYVGGTYDLGGGASILALYAEDEDGDQADEIASGEYDPGMTIEVNFTF